jgi:hypothetical protein
MMVLRQGLSVERSAGDISFSGVDSDSQPTMPGTLTVSSKSSPFPFSALAIAAFTGAADVVFDESAASISLDLDGDRFEDEGAIVDALAKAGGLSHDKVKVRYSGDLFGLSV